MADNLTVTPGTGASVATDDISGVHYHRAKIALGLDGAHAADLSGTAARGAYVDPRLSVVRLSATPTISTSIYAIGDAVGGLLTFTGAVRASGGSGRLLAVQILDRDQERTELDLVLFDRTITAPTDNAAFNPSDTEAGYCVGWVPIGAGMYSNWSSNAVGHAPADVAFVLNGTDLFGVLVTRGAPTFGTTGDLTVTLTIAQD